MREKTKWVRRAALVSLFAFLLLLAAPANSEPEPQDESEAVFMEDFYKREQLLFEEFPVVFSAAKMEQPVNWSPSSTTVITAEEIRRSGATNIADLLRRVPGLDVFRVSLSDPNVTARGLSRPASRTTLVLVDGMSVYRDYYGVVPWDTLPIVMEEIDRIEIIRGPGSALYGANAFSGVVNIMTKSPEQLEGTTLSSTIGQFDTYINTLINAGVKDKWSYKVTGNWTEFDSMEFHDETALKDGKVSITLGYRFDDDQNLTFSNRYVHVDEAHFLAHSFPYVWEGDSFYSKLNYNHGDWKFQTFYSLMDIDTQGSGEPYSNINNVFDFELQHTLRPNDQNTIVWGANYRHNRFTSHVNVGKRRVWDLLSFFVQDEYRPVENMAITGGARIDSHPETGVHFSPRLSVVYEPWKNHIFRASVGRAFRNPTYIETYLNLVSVSGPVVTTLLGDKNLDSEEMTSFELGYQMRTDDGRLHVKLDTFYNIIDEIIEFHNMNDPAPPPILNFEFDHLNIGKAIAYGGELSVDYRFTDWLSAYANYSFQYVEARDDGVQFQDYEKGERIKSSPKHKVNAGAYAEFDNGINMSVDAHYVDEIEAWFYDIGSAVSGLPNMFGHEDVDDYIRVDARIGYKFPFPNCDVEASLIVTNLFNDVHNEWAKQVVGGEDFERQFLFNVTGRF